MANPDNPKAEYFTKEVLGKAVQMTDDELVACLQMRRALAARLEHWDAIAHDALVRSMAFAVALFNPKADLREWRREMKKGRLSKRAWRRLRGRVKAGKPIPTPPALWIDFEAGPTRPTIHFASIYRKD